MSITWVKEKKRWRFEFVRVIGGERHRTSRILPAGWSRTQADAYDRKETARIYAIATGIEHERPLIADAVKLYLDHVIPHQKDGKKAAQTLALLLPEYQDKYLDQLADVCQGYIKTNTGQLKPATIRNRLAYLRAACRYAFTHHNLGEHDPAERVVLPTPNNARQFFPTRRQLLQAMRKCRNRESRAVLALAFYTGMRWKSEILVARLDGDILTATDTKNGKPHSVPVHGKALVYARKLPLKLKSWSLYKYIKEALVAVGLGHFTMHDQRHGTASTLINAGATLSEVGAFLNHSSAQATARYSHLVMSTKRNMLKRLAG